MIRCIVVDDKPLAIDLLTRYIAKVPLLELTYSTTNPLDALNKVAEGEVDLIFLDIQMPELTGLEFMKIVKGKCQIILTTAYSEYALEGFENDAVDYLLKPVSFDRFYKAVEKVKVIIKGLSNLTNETIDSKNEKTLDHIFVKTEYKLIRVALSAILYVEGMQNYVNIYTVNEKITSLQTMKKMEEQLPHPYFVRVHKSFIVAIDKIDNIERNRIAIADKVIALGDNYRTAFYSAINQ
ncbi:LytR/AlgR family response regulator transcription factor [Pedobacter duraquae]|uniref:LytTR family two component transcriptional regulator n=1 Tax=Pedobacter duraquae TaxID=425511 RepID=A0A4R6IH87_9SPHI|nr:LytTR family DNA-binding domain-containing protein [Pedobacter duraquae]TDO21316.1 LytTR family two component transcriptional regulator [Pedobacter duraquae]